MPKQPHQEPNMAEIITAIGRKKSKGGLFDAKSIKTKGDHLDDNPALFDFRGISLPTIFDDFHDGVTITDAKGRVVYYNKTQGKIDNLDPKFALNKKLIELYQVDEKATPMMACLKSKKPIRDLICFYRTYQGKEINSTHNIFPIFSDDQFIGAICFVKAYNINEQTFFSPRIGSSKDWKNISKKQIQKKTQMLANGTRFNFVDIVGFNTQLRRAIETARLGSKSRSSILLFGETGTGKELFAQSIHNSSPRNLERFVAVNCTSIPENLLEATLFGTSKGAFTGAINKPGLFELANNGTLFLDEINSMAIGLQAKLLRVLQEKKVRRVGSLEEKNIDIKIISSINVDPSTAIENKSIRPDLLYRLAVILLSIPPLRERKDDLTILTEHFLHKYNDILDKKVNSVSPEVNKLIKLYDWPGNVRELEHVIEGAMNLVEDQEEVSLDHLSFYMRDLSRVREQVDDAAYLGYRETDSSSDDGARESVGTFPDGRGEALFSGKTLPEVQRYIEIESICYALTISGGNAAYAAQQLGISPQLLNYKIKKYSLNRKKFFDEGAHKAIGALHPLKELLTGR